MAWVRIDDHFDEHPKMQRVGPLAWGVWLAGLAYCNRNTTDGFIPWSKARTLCSFEVVEDDGRLWGLSRTSGMVGEDIDAEWVTKLLVEAGLWEEVENGRGRVDGYMIHDYPDYQPLKAQIEEDRARKVAAGQAGGKASAQARAQAPAQAQSKQTDSTRSSKIEAKFNPKPVPVSKPSKEKESLSSERDEKATASPRSPRKFRLPVDWIPSEDNRTYARDRGMTDAEIDAEAEKFRDHFTGINPEARPGWDASWRTWIGRTLERPRPNLRAVNGSATGARPNYFAEKAKRLEAEQERTVPDNVIEGAWR
jgi:hypothetical protein